MKCEDDLWNKIEISITSNLFKINNQNKYVTNDFQKQNVLPSLGIEVHSMLSAAASKANKPEDDFIQTDQANACE